MRRSLSRQMKMFGQAAAVLLVFLLAFYLSVSLIDTRLTIATFGFKPFVVQSDSMKPLMRRGDLIVVTKANTNSLHVDEVIAVSPRKNDFFVAHYLAEQIVNEKHQLIFKTKPGAARGSGVERGSSDASVGRGSRLSTSSRSSSDPKTWDYWGIRREQVLGRASLVIPYAGHAILFLKTPAGLVSVVAALGCIYLTHMLLAKKSVSSNARGDAHEA